MEIKNLQGEVLFKSDSPSIKETIKDAIRKGISLNKAYLKGADLSGTDLRGADLRGADLMLAYLRDANLNGANLSGANLSLVNLSSANLNDTNLSGAYLTQANFSGANLSLVNLSGADLRGANLSWADLSLADLSGTNLGSTYLRSANLNGANLNGAKLSWANLNGAKNVPYIPLACPSEGSFIGWKKICSKSIQYLVKLRIPEDARRCSATTSKCRCDKAEVLAIERLSTSDKDVKQVVNRTYNECIYTVGEMVYPDSFDENRWNECSHGIHFFINKQDAIDY